MKRSDRFSLLGFSSDCEVESVAVEGVGGFGRNVNSPHFNYSSVGGNFLIFFLEKEASERGRK